MIRIIGIVPNSLMIGHHFTWENCLLHEVSESQYVEFVLSYKLVTVNTFSLLVCSSSVRAILYVMLLSWSSVLYLIFNQCLLYDRSSTGTTSCINGRSTAVKMRCNPMRSGAGVISVPRYSLFLCAYSVWSFFLEAKLSGILLLKHILYGNKAERDQKSQYIGCRDMSGHDLNE